MVVTVRKEHLEAFDENRDFYNISNEIDKVEPSIEYLTNLLEDLNLKIENKRLNTTQKLNLINQICEIVIYLKTGKNSKFLGKMSFIFCSIFLTKL